MLLYVAIFFVLLIVSILIFAASRPDTFRIQRETSIKAPADRIFALIDSLQSWQGWSPWERIDPALKRTHSGAASGKGAVYAWEGNKKVGQGRMEIIESIPASKITIQLDFLKPFEAHHTAEFTLQQTGDTTQVSWAMFGRQPFMAKVMCLFFNMDKMVGKDFESGLSELKRIAQQ